MDRLLPLLLTRVAAIVVAGLLLFAVFDHAHGQQTHADNYGLKRFPGDNYDSMPARLVPPSYAPAASNAAPAYPAQPADSYAYYRQAPRENADYVLGTGDKLRLNIFGESDL